MSNPLPFKISVLVFIKNRRGEHLLIRRNKKPNLGCWSPIGGKLEMHAGESPGQCAIRETREETGLVLTFSDLHLFSIIAEKSYEGTGHWLMFLYNCRKPVDSLPSSIDEGAFAFHSRREIDRLPIPETDRQALWRIYDQYRDGFVILHADCSPDDELRITIEEAFANIGAVTPPDLSTS